MDTSVAGPEPGYLHAEVEVNVLQARKLPRGLRRPSGVASIVVDGKVLAESEPFWRDTAPEFAFNVCVVIPYKQGKRPAFHIVVRDRSARNAELGRAQFALHSRETRGWHPLYAPSGAAVSHADILVAVGWAGCPLPEQVSVPRSIQDLDNPSLELRSVHPHTGRLFRAGTLRVDVLGKGVPAPLSLPFLTIATADQILRAGETPESRLEWEEKKAAELEKEKMDLEQGDEKEKNTASGAKESAQSLPCISSSDMSSTSADGDMSKRRTLSASSDRIRAKVGTKVGTAARLKPSRSAVRTAPTSVLLQAAHSLVSELSQARMVSVPNPATASSDASIESPGATSRARSGDESALVSAPSTRPILATLLGPIERRDVDFGSFSFAILQGVLPSCLNLVLTDSKSHLPNAMGTIFDQKIELPSEIPGFGPGPGENNTYNMHLSVIEKGPAGAKIAFSVRLSYVAEYSLSSCNIVTPRFLELLPTVNDLAPDFKRMYPHAEELTYLLVGGLFTNHYPTYFTRNIDFLQEKLCLPRVQSVPIHTESGVGSNAIAIRDAISKTCSRRKSIVLIGHSKGGVDILETISRYPEIIPFVYGIITYQAPFSGCFAIDFLARSKLAVKAISSAIETLWRGEKESFQDLSYSCRNTDLKLFDSSEDKGICSEDEEPMKESPLVFQEIPIVAVASCAPFGIFNIRSPANAAGVASMAPIAQLITSRTGFRCDGLVVPADARVPFCDLVYLEDMMHTEPALYVPGTKYPPGEMTASALVLLFEKAKAELRAQCTEK